MRVRVRKRATSRRSSPPTPQPPMPDALTPPSSGARAGVLLVRFSWLGLGFGFGLGLGLGEG